MKKFLLSIVLLLSSSSLFAASPFDMRFHCKNDTTEISALLKKGAESGIRTPGNLVAFYAKQLIGTPYVAHTLEGDKEYLTINIDQLDCTTFVETLYALTRSTLDGRLSWRDYAMNLESIRYRGGTMGDYSSRLHYISDWIANNSYRGNITEASSSIPGAKYEIKTLDFMSKHRDLYPALKDDEMFNKLKGFEIAYRMHRFPYVHKNALSSKQAVAELKNGDIIALLTKIDGLDASHMAIIIKEDGKLHMLHASSTDKKVTLETDEFKETMRRNRQWTGFRIIRIKE